MGKVNEAKKQDTLKRYHTGEISLGKFSEMLHITKWDALNLLKGNNIISNYGVQELEEDIL